MCASTRSIGERANPDCSAASRQSRLARHCLALRSCAGVIPLARAIAFAAAKPTWADGVAGNGRLSAIGAMGICHDRAHAPGEKQHQQYDLHQAFPVHDFAALSEEWGSVELPRVLRRYRIVGTEAADSRSIAWTVLSRLLDNHCSLSARVVKLHSRSWNARFSSGAVAWSARSLYSVAVARYCSAVHIDKSLARADLGHRVRRPAATSPLNADCSE